MEAGNGGQYDRGVSAGVTAGQIAQRLLEHDQQLGKVTVSMDTVASKLTGVEMALQRMADSMDADRATVIKTALALKEADDARRTKGEQRWSPLARVAATATTIAAVLSATAILLSHFH